MKALKIDCEISIVVFDKKLKITVYSARDGK